MEALCPSRGGIERTIAPGSTIDTKRSLLLMKACLASFVRRMDEGSKSAVSLMKSL